MTQRIEKPRRRGAVHHAVVERKAQGQHVAWDDAVADDGRLADDATQAQNGALRQMDDRRESIDAEHAAQLQAAFDAEDQPIILDLREVRRVDRDVLTALTRWDAEGIKFENCPAYVREWISRLQKKR